MKRSVSVVLAAVMLTSASYASQPSSADDRAVALLEKAVAALGEIDPTDLRHVEWEFSGRTFHRHSGYVPEQAKSTTPRSEANFVDLRSKRAVLARNHYFGVDRASADRIHVMDEDQIYTLYPQYQMSERLDVANPLPSTLASERLLSSLLVMRARENANSARFVGVADRSGGRVQVVEVALGGGAPYRLFFDLQSTQLVGATQPITDAVSGDATFNLRFTKHAPVNGVMTARQVFASIDDEPLYQYRLKSAQYNGSYRTDLLAQPARYRSVAERPNRMPQPLRLADDVYVIDAPGVAHNPLVVGFPDHVIVVDTPLDPFGPAGIFGQIKKIAGSRPIRYAVPTHFHFDHSAGLRSFVADGATIITTSRNRNFFERIARAPRTRQPDALSRAMRAARFEVVDDRRVFGTGDHRVEIINVGPNPHVRDMFVAWLPGPKILYVADIFERFHGHPLIPAPDATVSLARALEKHAIIPDVIAGAHSTTMTWVEFQEALRLRTRR